MSLAERAALILKIREQQDPCLQMKMTPTQQRANDCKARYIAVRGGNRTGKTSWSAKKLATIARQLPDVKTTSITGVYIVFAPSREQIQSPWAKKLLEGSELPGDLYERPFIPDYEIEHISYTYGAGDPTVKSITLKNGNKIIFCVSGDKNVWKRLEGKALLGAVLDESAGTEKLLTELMARLLDANSHPVVQREAGGAWVLWGATQTKKSPAFEQFLSLGQSETPEHSEYAAFTLIPDENPSVSIEERQKLAVMMSEDEYKIRMEGHGSAASAMAVYPQWDDERNLVKDADYIPGPDDNIWWFFDPGAHYAGIVLAAINKEHPLLLNVFKCMQPQRATLEQCVKMVRDELGGRALEGVIYDQAARKKEMSGRSAISEMAQILTRKGYDIKIHRGLMMGRSNYKDTVPLFREYLCTPPNYPGYPTKIILNRSPESGCQLLRWQIMNVCFKENDYELKEENIQKGNDHLSDSLRYGASRKPAYVYRGPNPKLWGDGVAGEDPDGDVHRFYKSTDGDTHLYQKATSPQTPGQRFAARRAKRLKAQVAKKKRW